MFVEARQGENMKTTVYFFTASVLLVASWLLYFLLLHHPLFPWLVYAGWAILGVGLVFIVLAIVTLRHKGRLEEGKDLTRTTTVVDSGIYAVVRHPLYLGWLLMYVAVILFSQHWLIVIMGVLGIVCMYLISRDEDQRLVEKFGDSYRAYIKSVPAMNALVGMIRLLR
jgi:protein-S-isoprenylcysteine O-methyltransferase Ste14